MTFKIMRTIWDDGVARHIMKFVNPVAPLTNETQMNTLSYYITYIVPKVRESRVNWRDFTMLNPLVITWLINTRKFENSNE